MAVRRTGGNGETVLRTGVERPVTARTRALLACGIVAGPIFSFVTLIQMLTRQGFDGRKQPLSLLGLGDLGFVQIANFIVAGLLVAASAGGLRAALRGGRGRTWGPILIGGYGGGLIWAGVFPADPAFGYPPGTPDSGPAELSWHGALHTLAPVIMNLALIAACVVFARRFRSEGNRGWAAYCVIAAVAAAVLIGTSFAAADFRLSFAGGVVLWTWASLIAGFLLVNLHGTTHPHKEN